jgi:hypothetical protein
MPKSQSILQSLTIVVLASGIVAIGAQELYQTYGQKRGSSIRDRKNEMLRDFRGEDVKARMSPDAAQRSASGRASSDGRAVSQTSRASASDSLTREDRSELDAMLSGILP